MTARRVEATALAHLLGRWAGRGPGYRNLAQGVRGAILDGRVPLEAALPGERELAAALGVSRTTVAAAYAELRDEGYLVTSPGARSRTALPRGAVPAGFPLPAGPTPTSGGLLDLAYATLPAPGGVIHRAYAAALEALPAHLPTHGYAPHGLPALREAIAARYSGRGLPTAPEQIVVTFGAQHALGLLVGALTSPGDRVLVDHPTYLHALDTLRQAACRIVPVPLTEEGWDVGGLRAAIRQTAPRLAYLIPDFHNPTGHLMPGTERAAVARAAHEGRTTVIVDETLADLALGGPPPPPFAIHDGHGTVVTVGSLSKSFWGGLRVGWIRAPRALTARLGASRAATDLGVPVLEQLAATHLLADPEPTLVARRDLLRQQRDVLVAELARHLPGWRYALPEGGLSLWAALPRPASSVLAATADRFGVRVAAGPRFGVDGVFEGRLRLPFTLPGPDLAEAVARLARAYAAVAGGGVAVPGLPGTAAV